MLLALATPAHPPLHPPADPLLARLRLCLPRSATAVPPHAVSLMLALPVPIHPLRRPRRANPVVPASDRPRPSFCVDGPRLVVQAVCVPAEFDFLRHSEHGARDAEWARPAHRQCITSWHKIERAKEEIVRLNVEIRRVFTHIQDEEQFLEAHYRLLLTSNPDLAHALRARAELNLRANRHILRDLESLPKLRGFSGDLSCGVRADCVPVHEAKPLTASHPDNTGVLVDSLAQLALADDVIPAAHVEDNEPSDEVLHALTGVEESCKIQ
ncbi:hypothetical protein FRC08_003245 [Ceratobasidium sp. 394]|nr:hypothetical protein FRC08_003245 [Ceratobasidium sp. 394]